MNYFRSPHAGRFDDPNRAHLQVGNVIAILQAKVRLDLKQQTAS